MRGILLATTYLFISLSAFGNSSCPTDFTQFVKKFSSNRSFQETHTKYPLSYISNNGQGDSCYPDCPFVEDQLSRQKAKNLPDPIFPLLSTQLEVPLKLDIKTTKNKAVIRVDKPDSDSFSFEYVFKRHNYCWQLISVSDFSI